MTGGPGGGSSGSTRRPMRGLSFWILVAIVALSPLPLGGARPVWTAVLGVLVSVALLSYVWQRNRLRRPMPRLPSGLVAVAAMAGLVAIWGLLQSIPGLGAGLAHPAWNIASHALPEVTFPASISVDPQETRRTVLVWLTYIGFGVLTAFHARRQSNAELLLRVLIGVQGLYAAYGLATYFSGLEYVLWFEKTAYADSLTSTFINRNSYATYVGLGSLAALAYFLRGLRRITQLERSVQGRVLTFAESFWGTVLFPVTVFSLGTAALLLTGSRMGLIAFAVSMVVFLVLWINGLSGKARWIGWSLIGVVVTVAAANLLLSGITTLSRMEFFFEQGDSRFQVYPLILQAIEDRPWTGHGLGAFESAFRLYRDENVGIFFSRAHSDWLEIPMEAGLPAVAFILSSFVLLFVAAISGRARKQSPELSILSACALLLVSLHSLVDFSLQIPAVMTSLLALLVIGSLNDDRA